MKYILGDCGRSYVAGFGTNPPTHVHHRGASCPLETGGVASNSPTCDYSNFNLASSNPNILYGALVGGGQHTHHSNPSYLSHSLLSTRLNELSCESPWHCTINAVLALISRLFRSLFENAYCKESGHSSESVSAYEVGFGC